MSTLHKYVPMIETKWRCIGQSNIGPTSGHPNKKVFFRSIITNTTLLCIILQFCMLSWVESQILKKDIPDQLVVLTFDDAPASQYHVVAPLLEKYNFNATFYVCEFPPNYADSSLYMNWRQIQDLSRRGFEIGNHTKDHAGVGKISKAEMLNQLDYIELRCTNLGIPKPNTFAYPGYNLSEAAIHTLSEQNYRIARAGGSRAYNPTVDHPMLIPSWAADADNKEDILNALKEAKEGQIVILTFHGVPDIEHPWVNTPPELFEFYLQFLKKNGYQTTTMAGLEKYIDFEIAHQKIKLDLSINYKN